MSIEGIPEGWELVRIGKPATGEWSIGGDGTPWQYVKDTPSTEFWPIIRKAAHVCTWPHGVFADGWITQDGDDDSKIEWHKKEPFLPHGAEWWSSEGMGGEVCGLMNPPVFRENLPWTKRVQQVGPSVEK